MIKFIKGTSSKEDMLQFIVNLLYLGMKSDNSYWAESNGTKEAVLNLLSMESDDFIKDAKNILLNGALTITDDQRLAIHTNKVCKDIEEYQDIVDVLRADKYIDDFSGMCRIHFKKLTEVFSAHEDPYLLR